MKLYPPRIEGTLPSFYKTTEVGTVLKVPFSMNRAVSAAEVYGYSLRVKDVINGEEIFTINTSNHSSTTEAVFEIDPVYALRLVVGSYYKFQLAYIDKDEETGYYSTVGVIKCTAKPQVEIKGLDLSLSNTHKYSYVGYYNSADDPTEKVYYYQFVLTDGSGNIVSDSGWQVHLAENNSENNNYESIDNYVIPFDLEDSEDYLLQYTIKTNNNLVIKSPKYKIVQTSFIEMTEKIKLTTELNYEEGYINIKAIYDQEDKDLYILDTSEDFMEYVDYYTVTYRPKELLEDDYRLNYYYIHSGNEYILDPGESFDYTKTYYEAEYNLIKLKASTYEPNKYYIKEDHFVRGNFLISRSSKDTNYKEWYQIATIQITGHGNLFYEKNDYTIEQGKYYRYSIQQYNNYGTLSARVVTDEIFSDFEHMFLYDGKRQLKIKYNPKISSFKINKLISKVDTIGGKYPYIFENSSTYYHEFPIAGLISYLMDENESFMGVDSLGLSPEYDLMTRKNTIETDVLKQQILENIYKINANNETIREKEENSEYDISIVNLQTSVLKEENLNLYLENRNLANILKNKRQKEEIFIKGENRTTNLQSLNIAAERIFKTEVLDWLNDGEPKLFRSPSEGCFIVIIANVSLTPEDSLGRMLHTFSSTAYEIADFNYNNLLNLGIAHMDAVNYNFLSWKTVNLSEVVGKTNVDNNYFLDEQNKAVTIYNDDVTYNYAEVLDGNIAYSAYFLGVQPGSIIHIDGEEIVIGGSGSYYTESQTGISSIEIPANDTYLGSLIYSYYGKINSSFNLIIDSKILNESGVQFIGNNEDIIQSIENNSNTIKNFGFLQFMMRDIVEVKVLDSEEWLNKYYLDNTLKTEVIFLDDEENYPVDTMKDIYYREESDRLDVSFAKVGIYETLELDNVYYKNNRSFINPIYTASIENKDEYYCVYQEDFVLPNTEEKINVYSNKYPLYYYSTDTIIFNNEIVELQDSINLYKDLYNNKYYIDEIEKENISLEFYNELIENYGFELLNFQVQIDNNTIDVGPAYEHYKVGKKFNIYEPVEINSEEEYLSYEILYDDESNSINPLETSYDSESQYYIYQDYTNFTFYTTADCMYTVPVENINANNCSNYYILDTVVIEPNYDKEHVRVLKDIYNFKQLIIGNGVSLNCAYQINNITYGMEDFDAASNKYYDESLQYYKSQMDYYKDIMMNGESEEFSSISLTDLDGIVEYYKNSILEEVLSIQSNDDAVEDEDEVNHFAMVQDTINKYAAFLDVYNSYVSGEITDLTTFKEALGDEGELLRTINSLIEEKIIVQNNAREQYLKFLKLYNERIDQLLIIYDEEG